VHRGFGEADDVGHDDREIFGLDCHTAVPIPEECAAAYVAAKLRESLAAAPAWDTGAFIAWFSWD
jgi:hypothetical protein